MGNNLFSIRFAFAMILLGSFSQATFAQTEPSAPFEMVLSAHSDTGDKIIPLREISAIDGADIFQVKINHIDQSVYKITVNGKSTDTTPSTLVFPPTLPIGFDDLTKLLSGLSPVFTAAAAGFTEGGGRESMLGDSTAPGFNEQVDAAVAKNGNPSDYINEYIFYSENEYWKFVQSKSKYVNITTYLGSSLRDHYLNKNSFDVELYQELAEEYEADVTEIIVHLNEIKMDMHIYRAVQKLDTAPIAAIARINTFIESLQQTAMGTLDSLHSDKVNNILSLLAQAQNNANTTYTSLPMQMTGRSMDLKITIEPRNPLYGQPYETVLELRRKQRYYFGAGGAFYFSLLHDDAYSSLATPVTDTTVKYSLVAEKPSPYEVGLSSLFYAGVYVDKKETVGIHLAMGLGMSLTPQVRPRALGGVGLSFGSSKQKLSIDVMAASGYVNRLSNAYSLEKEYSEKPEQMVVSRLSTGFALGLGYIYKF